MLFEAALLVCWCFSTVESVPGGVAQGAVGMMPPENSPMDGCMAIPPEMIHLFPALESDLWIGRWGDWFGSTYQAFMEPVVVADQWNDWTLNATKFKPAKALGPKADSCGETPDKLIRRQNATTPQELKIRLVNGPTAREGRLEVFYNGEWGTVCSDRFGEAEAQVVCNALGFRGSAVVRPTTAYSAGTGRIWLTGLNCEARFMHLADCHFNAFGLQNPACTHANDVGVMCLAENWTKMRLAGGATENEGRVEAFLMGEWGTVCDIGFTWKEAQAVCNSLGYWGKAELLPNTFGSATGKVWLDGVKCMPDKPHLAHCVHNEIGTVKAACTHTRDVAVRCSNMTMEYICRNSTNVTKAWRDRPYNMFNQGGMTQKMMESLDETLHTRLDMFTQCKSQDKTAGGKPGSMPPLMGGQQPGMGQPGMGQPGVSAANVQGGYSKMDGHDKPDSSEHPKGDHQGAEDLWKVLKAAITAIDYQKIRGDNHHEKESSDDQKHDVPKEVTNCFDINAPKMPSFVSNTMPCVENMSPQSMLNYVNQYLHDYVDQITREAMEYAMDDHKPMYPQKPAGVNTTMVPVPVTTTASLAAPPALQAGGEIWKCNFDTGVFCPDISNIQMGDQFDWTINQNKVATWYTGPDMDHSQKGKYAYTDITNQAPGNKARLQIQKLTVPSGGACIEFWYHMFGKEQGTLKLWVKNTATSMDSSVWEKSGQQSINGMDWKLASHYIMTSGTYVVTFEAQVAAKSQNGEGDIALDDILVTKGACLG